MDKDVDRIFARMFPGARERFQNSLPGDGSSSPYQQDLQQCEFARRQSQAFSGDVDLPARYVETQRTVSQDWREYGMGATQRRPHSCHELPRIERLCKIVVRAGVEAADAVRHRADAITHGIDGMAYLRKAA